VYWGAAESVTVLLTRRWLPLHTLRNRAAKILALPSDQAGVVVRVTLATGRVIWFQKIIAAQHQALIPTR